MTNVNEITMELTPQEVINMIAGMTQEQQDAVYKKMKENGLTEKKVKSIQHMVFQYKLFNNEYFHDKVVNYLGNKFYEEINNIHQ